MRIEWKKFLSQTDKRGVDVAIVATSSLKALEDAIEMVRKVVSL